MAQKIEIVRGTTNTFQIAVTDAEGREYALVSGEKVVFGIKKNPEDDEAIFVKTITKGIDGIYVATIEASDTEDLDPGKYFYDVGLRSGDKYYNIIEPSTFMILPNITRWGDGQ